MLRIVEAAIILGLMLWQLLVYRRNMLLVRQVATLYPGKGSLSVQRVSAPNPDLGGGEWDQPGAMHGLLATIEYDAVRATSASPEFTQILNDTNDYLQANKGAAADFDTLRDISEREATLLDEEIQAQISTPLYLGLLGTFGGAILGLLALVNPFGAASGAAADFNNSDVTEFLGGVLIAMIGSIVGLGLTLLGNQQLKAARATRDRLKNAYYNFLQKTLLPKLNSDMQQSMSSLKAVLDTFNQDFFAKIQVDFFAKIAEFTPLIGAITANIEVQKNFLEKLQTIGYTELANATIKVFDRVDESAASFEKFLGYQQALNVAVSQGADVARTITGLLDRLGGLEKALNEVPGYLEQHDQRIREQVQFFGQHSQLLRNVSDQMSQALSEDAQQMRQVLDSRRHTLEAEAQAAHAQWSAHFRQLNENNIYQKITEYLNPFQQLPAQQLNMNKIQEEQARRSAQALTALQERIERDEQVQRELLTQVARTNTVLEKITEPKWYQRMFGAGKKPSAR
ncbi:hypothetical protein Q5H93_22870 [Hymenobacter sp. ASUV-10]|uniref:MotA/TolQ/ExbB proton channel domain-containing protein n=1 Tax=Hymenobacter aranciens TaxID=3063996 RepID=A0ABT9BIH1_9BACT|nr:hypothetical protein [Hymenobacter sp. ASUV-10]MDO7877600.1 hypothetical protein [Hymenobacter sp. ASUV-10]